MNDEDTNETLTPSGIQLSPKLVKMVLGKISSPTLALRFFQWAKTQIGFKHNDSTYENIGNIVGSFKDLETLEIFLSNRFFEGPKFYFKIFSFATFWHDNPTIVNKVLEMINKLGLSSRIYAYEILIGSSYRTNRVNASLVVLEKRTSVD